MLPLAVDSRHCGLHELTTAQLGWEVGLAQTRGFRILPSSWKGFDAVVGPAVTDPGRLSQEPFRKQITASVSGRLDICWILHCISSNTLGQCARREPDIERKKRREVA